MITRSVPELNRFRYAEPSQLSHEGLNSWCRALLEMSDLKLCADIWEKPGANYRSSRMRILGNPSTNWSLMLYQGTDALSALEGKCHIFGWYRFGKDCQMWPSWLEIVLSVSSLPTHSNLCWSGHVQLWANSMVIKNYVYNWVPSIRIWWSMSMELKSGPQSPLTVHVFRNIS